MPHPLTYVAETEYGNVTHFWAVPVGSRNAMALCGIRTKLTVPMNPEADVCPTCATNAAALGEDVSKRIGKAA